MATFTVIVTSCGLINSRENLSRSKCLRRQVWGCVGDIKVRDSTVLKCVMVCEVLWLEWWCQVSRTKAALAKVDESVTATQQRDVSGRTEVKQLPHMLR